MTDIANEEFLEQLMAELSAAQPLPAEVREHQNLTLDMTEAFEAVISNYAVQFEDRPVFFTRAVVATAIALQRDYFELMCSAMLTEKGEETNGS